MSPLIPTVNGNGPYVPVVVYKRKRYPVGQRMADIQEALDVAFEVACSLRDTMRAELPEGWR